MITMIKLINVSSPHMITIFVDDESTQNLKTLSAFPGFGAVLLTTTIRLHTRSLDLSLLHNNFVSFDQRLHFPQLPDSDNLCSILYFYVFDFLYSK